jgi:hypothetical protein
MAQEIQEGPQAQKTVAKKSVAQLVEEGPDPSFTGGAGPSPIGVPKGYLAKRTETVSGRAGDTEPGTRTRTIESTLPPRYFDGDEMQPANFPPNIIAEKQRALVEAGLMDEADYHAEMGSWGSKSIAAYSKLLQNANATGQDESTALGTYTAAAKARGTLPSSKVAAPLVVSLTNPADIRKLANDTSTRLLGRRLSEEQLANHVAAWQQSERQAQEDAYRMTGSGLPGGTGGTITEPARVMDETIRNENPEDSSKYDSVGRFNAFESLLTRFN